MKRLFLFALVCLALAGCSKPADAPQPVARPSLLVGTWDLTDHVTVTAYNNGSPPVTFSDPVLPGEVEFTFTAAGVLTTIDNGTAQRPAAYVYAGNKLTVTYADGNSAESTVTTLTAERLVFYHQLVGTTSSTTRTLSFKRR